MKICINGNFVDSEKARISPLDNGFLYGDGIYETMRTYKGKVLELNLHLKRLKKSSDFLGIKLPWSLEIITTWVNKLCRLNKANNARVRITLTRGDNGFDFLTSKKPLLVIISEKLVLDPKIYRHGVKTLAFNMERMLPAIKTIGLTAMVIAYRYTLPKKMYEAVLVDDNGFIREGASTNVFFIRNGKYYTPKTKILEGLTRNRVIDLLKENNLPIVVKDLYLKELGLADEIFLTNRPREIIPVVEFNGKRVGNGKVGFHTKKIMGLYRDYVLGQIA